jgi:hypothetical protein
VPVKMAKPFLASLLSLPGTQFIILVVLLQKIDSLVNKTKEFIYSPAEVLNFQKRYASYPEN